jgi:hypothetical protein
MIQLFSLQNDPLPNRAGVWLAVHRDAARHMGLFFRKSPTEQAQLLHLGFHHELHCDVPVGPHFEARYAWLSCPGFSSEEQTQLAVWFDRVWLANGEKVPYGLSYSGTGYFELATGRFIPSPSGVGLTCATFVMAMFEDFELPILAWESWPVRATADTAFQQSVIDELDRRVDLGQAERAHVDAQIGALGRAPRFRPDEVAASGGAYLGDPVTFPTAELLARHLQTDLASLI